MTDDYDYKDRYIEMEHKNPKNWKTQRCAHCGSNTPVFRPKYDEAGNPEPVWCVDCEKKLFGKDED